MYVLDTSALIDVLTDMPNAEEVFRKIGEEIVTTTALSVHEYLEGATEKEKFMIKNLTMDVLPFTVTDAYESGMVAQMLAKQGKLINETDILISGICLSHGATLVTFDKDFDRVSGLKLLKI